MSDSCSEIPGAFDEQQQAQSTRPHRGPFLIAWFIALYLSCILDDTSSTIMNITVSGSCIQYLTEVFDERRVTLIAIVFATVVPLYEIRTGQHLAIFISYVCVVVVGGGLFFLVALRNVRSTRDNICTSKGLIVANLAMRLLLSKGIIPMDEPSSPGILPELHRVFFSLSFILSIMSLWLQTIGIPLMTLSTMLKGRCEGAPVIATILHWSGAASLVAYIFLTVIVSSPEIPIITKFAYVVFSARGIHALFG